MTIKNMTQDSVLRRPAPDVGPQKNLAVAVIRQAWHEAVLDLERVKEASREDYRILKCKAIEWICSDEEDGFVYWCQLADMNHYKVRQKLAEALRSQNHPDGPGTA